MTTDPEDSTSQQDTPTVMAVDHDVPVQPRMEVRVKHLSLYADIPVNPTSDAHVLPTLSHAVASACRGLVAKRTTTRKAILSNVNGVFKPGTMTLVLGQPGSGKSSLMKILSGRFPITKNVTVDGDITYNGTLQHDIRKCMPQFVTYVGQRDHHCPTLTVHETLAFAHECAGGVVSTPPVSSSPETPIKSKTDLNDYDGTITRDATPSIIISQLGLGNCEHTIVGDAMLRGVSGGERKRVTLGEMQFGDKPVAFMDEISTGLDSAATFDIISTQRKIVQAFHKTVVIALLQPAPEVVALFDYVLLLNDGVVMYHGPRELVMGYFESLGLSCPPYRDHADFLMDLGTKQQLQYETKVNDGSLPPRTASEFACRFENSAIHAAMLSDLDSDHDPSLHRSMEEHFSDVPEFHQSFWASTKTLTARQLKITLRNGPFLKGRALMVVVTALLYGSLFWQFDVANVQVVMGLLFSSVLFLALGQASQLPTYMAARDVFYKQRGANMFRTSSFVLASSVSQLPLALAESIVFGTFVYWACGFVPVVSTFLVFEALVLVTNLAFAAFFFYLASASPNLHIAKPIGMVAIMLFILFAGFVISRDQIPVYYQWLYWLNPIAWCLRSVAINQYRTDMLNVDEFHGVNYMKRFGKQMGEYSLSLFDIEPGKQWLWYGFLYLIGSYVVFMWLSFIALEYNRYESPQHIAVGRNSTTTEDQPTEGSAYEAIETPKQTSCPSPQVAVAVPAATSLTHVPVTLAFERLWYSVPHPSNPKDELELLKDVSGYAKPGTITALMGSTGAGKTTLMDVIAGRKTGGKIRGRILLNGHEATDVAIRRCTGYCEQMDVHCEASTIREALMFSAFLRQDASVPDTQKYETVDEVLDLLDLRPIADQIIRGSSVEQMKRLTIGVELAAQPSVLFLDEPTSGLDARSAKVIIDGVRKVANTGRTVVCTIHQPSWEVFQVFDSLLLLKKGGQCVYFGELGHDAHELIAYFESIDNVTPLERGYNPATWMLETIGAGVGNTTGQDTDFVSIFQASGKKAELDEVLNQDGVTRPATDVSELAFTRKRASTVLTQFKFLTWRFFHVYWRTASYNVTRYIVYAMLAIIFGTAFVSTEYDTYQGINGGVGVVFVTTAFLGLMAFNSVLPITMEERASFYRERAAQTYNALWYFVGATLVEIPYVATSTLVYCSIFLPLVGFSGVKLFVFYWVNTALFVLLQVYLGQLFAFALPSVEVAAILGVLMNSVCFMFLGFNPPASTLPSGFVWLYDVIPHKYTLAVLVAAVFGDCGSSDGELACRLVRDLPPTQPQHLTVKSYVEEVFWMKHHEIGSNVAIVVAFIVFVRVLALLSLRFINHQKK